MCMASVWIKKNRGEENLLKEVAFIRSKGKKLILSTLLGEEKSVEAKIEEIDFMNSKVLLK
jgi:predicted RNA-binding protein